MESRTIKGVEHYVFDSAEEFEAYCQKSGIKIPTIKNWHTAQAGEWVWSDDGRIVQLLFVGDMSTPIKDKTQRYVRTVVGSFVDKPGVEMDTNFDKHPNRYTFSQTIKDVGYTRLKRDRISRFERQWIAMMVMGIPPVDAFLKVSSTKSVRNAETQADLLLKQERITKALHESIKEAAATLGLTDEWVLERLKRLAEGAKSEKIQLDSTREVAEILGTKPGVQKETRELIGAFRGFGEAHVQKLKETVERPALPEGIPDDQKGQRRVQGIPLPEQEEGQGNVQEAYVEVEGTGTAPGSDGEQAQELQEG